MGVVYALTNEAMEGLVKIGRTSKSVEKRMSELYKTGVPVGFVCLCAIECENFIEVEKTLHKVFSGHGQRPNTDREFFKVNAVQVLAAMKLISGKDVTPKVDVLDEKGVAIPIVENSSSNRHFSFRSADIPIGAVLTFLKDESITGVVVDDNNIDFRGEIMSLSKSGVIAINECGYSWGKIAGPRNWIYEDEIVKDRQRRIQDE
jgi:hypothetical protein